MARLDGSLLISEISIPGTHETMASESGGRPIYCQSVQDLRLQLDAGIRALDIRCRHAQNRFAIHHAAYYQAAWFGEPYVTNEGDKNVMQMCVQFLYDNPTEFILMRIKQTHTEGHCNRSFAETFEWYRDEDGCNIATPNGDSAIQYKDFIWTTSDYATDEYPTVDEVRGKIVILQDFANRYRVGNAPYHVIAADLDKDGYEDIITVVTDDDKLCIQMNSEHGFITNKKYLSTGDMPREVCAADFNNDGWLDLAASNWDHEVEIFANKGDGQGNFHNPSSYNVEDKPMGIAAGDLNNDNLPDVAVACQGSKKIAVMYNGYNEIPGKFRTVHYKSGGGPRDVCITDLNVDGWNDIGYVKFNDPGHDYMAILINNKNSSGGFFDYSDITNNAPNYTNAIATGDFNDDGCPDLLATGTRYGKLKVATCTGNGANYDFEWHDCGKGPRDAAVGDFNEDGWPDFAIAKYQNDDPPYHNYMAVFLNEGCGNSHFLPYEDYYAANDPEGMWTADLDNDGHLDLITTGKSERCIEIFDGNGKGKFFSAQYGLPWSKFSIQDNYEMWCLSGSFNSKWNSIKSKIDEARQGARGTLYINFTSGSTHVDPIDVANGCAELMQGMNQRTYNYLKSFLPDNPGRCGVIMMDYPGPGLIEAIIKQNKLMVYLDIKPGSCPNPFSINIPEEGKPLLPVAVLGTPDFDVSTIDPSTVRLEHVEPLSSSIKDVSTPPDPVTGDCAGTGNGHDGNQDPIINAYQCRYSCTSEGTDGYPDLTLRFLKADIVNAIADQADQGQVFLKLTGALYDGTPIEGTDRIDLRGIPGSSAKNSASETTLQGNYPNPFNSGTKISFALPEATRVKLQVFNILGQEVTTLIDGHMEAGSHTVMWDGNKMASGIYLYRLQADDVVETKKMLLLK
ncbi:MAG: VCBS repeat-containing protein [Candidatus Zixiibacteriota bacterium]|nr:MAG: VCBS repeat-containing protein [candidate division Zixibacteria bacterium]